VVTLYLLCEASGAISGIGRKLSGDRSVSIILFDFCCVVDHVSDHSVRSEYM